MMKYITSYYFYNETRGYERSTLEKEANKSLAFKDLCALTHEKKKYNISSNKIAFFRNFGSFVNLDVVNGVYTYYSKSDGKVIKSESGNSLDECIRKLWFYILGKNLKNQNIDFTKYVGKAFTIEEIIKSENIQMLDYTTLKKECDWLNDNLNKLNLSITCERKQGKPLVTIFSSGKEENGVKNYITAKYKTLFFKILEKKIKIIFGDEKTKIPESDNDSIGIKLTDTNIENAINSILKVIKDNIKLLIIIPPAFAGKYEEKKDVITSIIKMSINAIDFSQKNIIDGDLFSKEFIDENPEAIKDIYNDIANDSDNIRILSVFKKHFPYLYNELLKIGNDNNMDDLIDMGFGD